MRKYLVTCSIALLLILLQTDVMVSASRKANNKSSGGGKSSRPGHERSRPADKPIKPADKPIKPADKPADKPIKPADKPIKPADKPIKPVHNEPVQPAQNPAPPAYNPHHPVNPPQNPAFPAQNPGDPHRNPSYPHNPSWGDYDIKPWKPKPPKAKMKHVAGAAVAGTVAGVAGGFLLGRALSNMHFHFNNQHEEWWWYEHRNHYSDRVYYPDYAQPVPEEVFVQDCWNITVREFIEPSGNQTADEMATRVVTRVVHEMCMKQYRSFSSHADGGSFGHHDSNPEEPKPTKPGVKHVAGERVTGIVVADGGGSLLGSSWSKMRFPLNDSDEEQWWKENQDRFTHQFYKPNYSQPLSKEDFVGDCVNVTVQEYLIHSGNQTDEMETRVGTRVVGRMCIKLFHSIFSLKEEGSFVNSNKPEEPTMPAKIGMKHVAGAAITGTVAGASGGFHSNSATSNMHYYFNVVNILHLSSPPLLLFLMLFTCFLIP